MTKKERFLTPEQYLQLFTFWKAIFGDIDIWFEDGFKKLKGIDEDDPDEILKTEKHMENYEKIKKKWLE